MGGWVVTSRRDVRFNFYGCSCSVRVGAAIRYLDIVSDASFVKISWKQQ